MTTNALNTCIVAYILLDSEGGIELLREVLNIGSGVITLCVLLLS